MGLLICIALVWKQAFPGIPEFTDLYKLSLAKSILKHCPRESVYIIFRLSNIVVSCYF